VQGHRSLLHKKAATSLAPHTFDQSAWFSRSREEFAGDFYPDAVANQTSTETLGGLSEMWLASVTRTYDTTRESPPTTLSGRQIACAVSTPSRWIASYVFALALHSCQLPTFVGPVSVMCQ
jgi:hypothetical protein